MKVFLYKSSEVFLEEHYGRNGEENGRITEEIPERIVARIFGGFPAEISEGILR